MLWSEQDTEREVLRVAYAGFGITGMAAVSKALKEEDVSSTAPAGTAATPPAQQTAPQVEPPAPPVPEAAVAA